tara:strand:- start:1202 stop:1366 length:165 start_codon:yes stop_codon:yes gene_type:complete
MNTEYALSNQELFFIVAQTAWDFFLIVLLSVIISIPIAYIWAIIEMNQSPKETK